MNVETRTTQRSLPVKLTESEIIGKHMERQQLAGTLKATKQARQEIMTELNREKRELGDAIKALDASLEAGAEERMVDCEMAYDYSRGIVTTTRLDTGETIEEREMQGPERQAGLDLQDPTETSDDEPAEPVETPVGEPREPADAAQAAV